MRKFTNMIYFLVMAMLVFAMSGCGGSSDNEGDGTSSGNKIMTVSSPVFKRGESYKLYKGGNFMYTTEVSNNNPKYYVAPISGNSETVSLNLEFADTLGDEAFMFVLSEDDYDRKVVFAYNPNGTSNDTTTAFGEVRRLNNGTQQKYTSLTFSGSSVRNTAIDIDTTDQIIINLNGTTATVGNSTAVPVYNYVWHADPNHANEYYTLTDSNEELTEAQMLAGITTTANGVYIARDIRYTPNTLDFSTTQTATKDGENEYVVYYSDEVAAEVSANLSSDFAGPYIFATLPMTMTAPGGQGGQGRPGDGNPPARPGSNVNINSSAASDIASFETMTHSAEDAYNNPVLHITQPGTYRLRGTWNGQIWIDAGNEDDDNAQVAVILDGVNVTCTVAPAIVFHDLYECGPDNEDSVKANYRTVGTTLHSTNGTNAGAIVVIADGSTNTFTGANVYRILKAEPKSSATKVNGTDIGDQKKLYKMDAAFYSFVSMVIGAQNSNGGGSLNITSTTFEGLDSELHMLIDGGTITITAPDDGINVNEDDISVFTMDSGTLNITSSGGDGIDSNGYVVINGGTLNITAGNSRQNSNGEAGIDAEGQVYISDNASYNWTAYSENGNTQPGEQPGGNESDNTTTRQPVTIRDNDETIIMELKFDDPVEDSNAGTPRTVPTESDIFTLESNRSVNTFSGITAK